MSTESIETIEFQIKQMEDSLNLPQTSIQQNRSLQILYGLRERLELEKKAHARRMVVNPEGLKRRAELTERLGSPYDAPARVVFKMLLGVADAPHAGLPAFIEDHFQPQDYIDAMEEFVTDPDISDSDRQEVENLLADLKESVGAGNGSEPTVE